MSYIEIDNDEIIYKQSDTDKLVILKSSTTSPGSSTALQFTFAKDTAKTITGITAANPAVVTSTAHGYENDDVVYISDVEGMTEVNGFTFTVANKTNDTFELSGTDSSAYTAYTSAGTCHKVINFTFPSALPENTNAKFLVSDLNGNMTFAESGGDASINGEFSDLVDGGTDIADDETINGAVTKLDTWIFNNLVDTPPLATINFHSNSTVKVRISWTPPTVYQYGFIDRTFPYITNLYISVYKNTGAASALTGTLTTDGTTAVSGSGTNFTGELAVGDSIIITGSWSGTPVVKDSDNTGNTLKVDGFDEAPQENQTFQIAGLQNQYFTITSISGTWVDNTTELTLTLNNSMSSTPSDGAALTRVETRVVKTVTDNTNLVVYSAFNDSVSGGSAENISYTLRNTYNLDDTSFLDNLPRENSTSIAESFNLFINSSSTSDDGNVVELDSLETYNKVDTGIASDDIVKIELYYSNLNSNNENKKSFLGNLVFASAGVPIAPTSYTNTSQTSTTGSISWTAPVDNDDALAGNQTDPPIDNYKISYSSNSLSTGINRFGGAVTHNPTDVTTSNTSRTLSSLHAGQSYSVEVRAKNTENSTGGDGSGYGPALSGTTELTTIPNAPSYLNSYSLSNPSTTFANDNNARTLGAHTLISHKILDHNTLGTWIDYSTLSNVGVNEDQSELETDEIKFQALFGTNGTTSTEGTPTAFRAFADPFPYAGTGTETENTNTKIKLYNQEDNYSDTYQEGFWSILDIDLHAKVASTPPSESNYYTVGLNYLLDDVVERTISVDNFYVCDLANNPSVTLVENITFTDTNQFNVSGIPSRGDGFQISYDMNIQYLGRYFIRYDKLANSRLKFNTSTNISSSVDFSPSGITSFVYDDGSAVSAPIDNSDSIQLSESVTYNNTDIFTTTSQYITLNIIPYSIKATGSTYTKHFINASDELDDTGKLIYVDTVSKNILDSYYDGGYNSSGGYVTIRPTRDVFNEDNDTDYLISYSSTPTDNQFDASTVVETYDHDEIIVGNVTNTYYNNELQFVNGRLRTIQDTNSFIDYPTNFLNVSSKNMTDYSGANNSEFRYASFEYDLSNVSTTIDYIDIVFNNFDLTDPSIASTGVIDNTKFKMYMKLIDNESYTVQGDETDYTSVWLDCNAVLSTAVGRSKTNYSSIANEPLAVLQNASSGNTDTTPTSGTGSTTHVKRVILATGTSTTNLKVFLRVGFHMGSDITMGYITLKHES